MQWAYKIFLVSKFNGTRYYFKAVTNISLTREKISLNIATKYFRLNIQVLRCDSTGRTLNSPSCYIYESSFSS